MKERLPTRWAFKHGAYYYRPRPAERHLFGDRSWFRLGKSYPEALRAFADRKELDAGETLASIVDRYMAECLHAHTRNTQASYTPSLKRIRAAIGHNRATALTPQVIYRYMDAVKKARTMNVANNDLKVINVLLDSAIRWGVIPTNQIKGNVSYFGKRDGLRKERDRYVEDWELAEWQKVATPVQKAFAALAMVTGGRKTDILQITLGDIHPDHLRLVNRKSNKEVRYRMSVALREAIELAKAVRTGDSLFLFTNATGGCFVSGGRCESFDRSWRHSMVQAIGETRLETPFTRHDLRAKVGSDADTDHRAQQLLGHTDPAMTRRHYRRNVPLIDPAK
jgi:integrase